MIGEIEYPRNFKGTGTPMTVLYKGYRDFWDSYNNGLKCGPIKKNWDIKPG